MSRALVRGHCQSRALVYDVAEVVDPQPHIVAKAPKSVLAALKKAPARP